ncbi:MAG: glycosyltransferase family 2 protein [Burkholderiales bacterium]
MTLDGPAVTVLTPVFNGGRFLRSAIESVLRQTFADFELLVIDDGSTDGSADIVRSFSDPRIRLLQLPTNKGLVFAVNLGLREARAPLVARLDADDLAMPERLERQLAFLDANPPIAVVGSWVALIDETDRAFMTSKFPVAPQEIYRALLVQNCLNHSCATFRKAAVESVGGYRALSAGHPEDYDLWLRLAERFELANLPEVLGCYRIHPAQITQRNYVRQRAAGNTLRYAAAVERHRLGRLDNPVPYAPPGLLTRLRGEESTSGSDCIGWSQVYRTMGRPGSALGFSVRACVRSPLTLRSWKAALLALLDALVPRRVRQSLAWYTVRLRSALGSKQSAPPSRDRIA